MSVKKYKYSYRDSSSKLHKAVGEILRTDPKLKNFRSLQEYPLPRPHANMHIDWMVLDFNLAIEIHGEQHYMPVTFGGITEEEATKRFLEQQKRDKQKKSICQSLGWKTLDIPYTVKNEDIAQLILDAIVS